MNPHRAIAPDRNSQYSRQLLSPFPLNILILGVTLTVKFNSLPKEVSRLVGKTGLLNDMRRRSSQAFEEIRRQSDGSPTKDVTSTIRLCGKPKATAPHEFWTELLSLPNFYLAWALAIV